MYKSYKRGKRYSKKHTFLQSTKRIAMKAARGVAYLKGIVNAELKRAATGTVTATVDDAGLVQPLFETTQGINSAQRIGLSVKANHMEIRYVWKIHGSATTSQVRCIIFVDKQQVADSDTNVTNFLSNIAPLAPYSNVNKHRFKVLHDGVYSLNSISKGSVLRRLNIKLGFNQRYNGVALTDIQKNGIFLLTLSSEATNTPTFLFSAAMYYYDN